MRLIVGMIAAPLFVAAIVAHFVVRRRLRGGFEDLDEYYYEFEEQHPGYARYLKWSRITFGAAVVAALALFVALAI